MFLFAFIMHLPRYYFWLNMLLKCAVFRIILCAISLLIYYYIPRRKSGIYWIQVRRAAAAAVEISLWTR